MSNPYIEKAIQTCLMEYLHHLDENAQPSNLYDMIIGEAEAALLKQLLEYYQGNQSHTANALGITRNTLKKKLMAHKLYVGRV